MNLWPYIVLLLVLAGLLAFSMRNRRRQVAQEMVRVSQISVGSEVMTTSGLYATVVEKHDDGTVQLSIAPGVEVKWALAALRDARSLSPEYQRGLENSRDDAEDSEPGTRTFQSADTPPDDD